MLPHNIHTHIYPSSTALLRTTLHSVKGVMQFYILASLVASNNTKHRNNFAALSANVGRPGPINHTHGDLVIACLFTLRMCTSYDYHPVSDLWGSTPSSGVGECINILLMALLASLSPGRPAEMSSACLFSLINSVWKRSGERWEAELERSRIQTPWVWEKERITVSCSKDVIQLPLHWPLIERHISVKSEGGRDLSYCTKLSPPLKWQIP